MYVCEFKVKAGKEKITDIVYYIEHGRDKISATLCHYFFFIHFVSKSLRGFVVIIMLSTKVWWYVFFSKRQLDNVGGSAETMALMPTKNSACL